MLGSTKIPQRKLTVTGQIEEKKNIVDQNQKISHLKNQKNLRSLLMNQRKTKKMRLIYRLPSVDGLNVLMFAFLLTYFYNYYGPSIINKVLNF